MAGTVAARAGTVHALGARPFATMRDSRNINQFIPDAGWHFSWLGGRDRVLQKLNAFCHPEIADRCLEGLEQDLYISEGYHVDGRRQVPVDVDETWPAFIREQRCPESWFRPR